MSVGVELIGRVRCGERMGRTCANNARVDVVTSVPMNRRLDRYGVCGEFIELRTAIGTRQWTWNDSCDGGGGAAMDPMATSP